MLCERRISSLTLSNKLTHKLLWSAKPIRERRSRNKASSDEDARPRQSKTENKKKVNDLFKGGAPQSQRNINANEIYIEYEDLQKCCAHEPSQA